MPGTQSRALVAPPACAEIAEAAALHDLDAFLQRAVEIVKARFNADLALLRVDRRTRKLFWAPQSGPFAADHLIPHWETFRDAEFSADLESRHERITHDLRLEDAPSAGQRLLRDHGIRSAMWCAIRDERGAVFGYLLCASLTANSFGIDALEELKLQASEVAWQARPAILIEAQEAERSLLAEESRLLTLIAEAETEPDLYACVAEGVRRALAADLTLAMVDSPGNRPPTLLSAPTDALSADLWEKARAALMTRQNRSMTERSRVDGAFAIADLAAEARTPIELFMRDDLGMSALVSANRSHEWGGLGLGIAVLRAKPGEWTAAERGFLARIARVFEISVERLRRGKIAIDHNLQLEQQADLLATGAELLEMLSSAEDLDESCSLISARLREFFDADHVAFGMLNLDEKSRTVLGASSRVMHRAEFSSSISDSDVAAYSPIALSGTANFISDLGEITQLNAAALVLKERGIRSIMRAPFKLSDGSLGMVTVGSVVPGRFGAIDAERLLDLCRPVGVAIDRVRLLGNMARTTAALDAKTHILAALVPGATAESAGSVFVNQTLRLFGASHAVVALFDAGDVRIVGMVSQVVEPAGVREVMAGKDAEPDANWRRVIALGEPQLVTDLGALQRTPAEEALLRGGLHSIMRVPILDSQRRVRGIVTAGSETVEAWTADDLETFGELSSCLGLVFERADLYERAEQRSAKIQALTRLLSTLSLNSPPEEVARQFAAQVRDYLDAEAVVVYALGNGDQRDRVAFDAAPGSSLGPEKFAIAEAAVRGRMMQAAQLRYTENMPGSGSPWLEEASRVLGFASTVCVRLDAAGEPIGMIAAGSTDPDGMGPAELEILSAVAGPLGMVLERARALTTLRLQTQRTRAIQDILAALGPAESIEQVATPVANALRMMYAADHCAIGEIENGFVRLVAVESAVTRWRLGDTLPLTALWGESPPSTPVVHVISDLDQSAEDSDVSRAAREAGMRSSMRVLIGPPADPLGVVTVGSRQPGRFTEFDARQLVQIVQPLAVAARYFRGRRETALRTERLETTNRILTRLSAGGTAEHLARGFLTECRALFNSCHALAVQFDQQSGTGRILALDTDIPEARPLPTEFVLDEMHSARLVRQPTPHLVTDARQEAALNIRHRDLIEQGVYSAVRAPLVVHDTVRGAVSLWGRGANCFTAEDAELLGTLTRPLALALEKASALQSLGESELKYRSLVAQADEMIFLFDPTTLRILDANAFTSQVLGYDHQGLLDVTLDVVLDAPRDEIVRTVASAIEAGELHLTDARFVRAAGGTIDVDAVASMVTFGGRQAVLVLARDVSERKAIMRQLIQSQKMDSLGAMAGAVAHDFNNLLTTILGFAGLLKRSANMDAEERENLALIEDAARRAADLTGRLLSFSRGGLVRFGRVDLRTVLEDTLQLAEPTMHSALRLTRELPAEPAYVEGDAGQIQQALTNIILNARDAMPEGGDIHVSVSLTGELAVITIADTGPGMDEETRVRIFEPFYTTKPAGSGTGLGMAITYGIIQGHHGDIAVESAPGRGTTFTITLPLMHSDDAPPVDMFNAGEGNLVLVVDDDAMVRRTTTATLAELGYNVVEAPGGSTAVEIMRARPDRFSVVLLDLVMPGMTGSETFRALTSIRPDLPVVVCTGYAADSHIDTDVKRRIAGLVQKPFTAERLSRALLAAGAQPTRPARI